MKIARWSNKAFGYGFGLVLLGSGPATADQALGRLFLNPMQREALERMRWNDEQARMLRGSSLRLDGVVRRSSGKKTIWLNGVAQQDDDAVAGITVALGDHVPGLVTVRIVNEPAAKLQVGETINRATREKITLLGDGGLVVRGPGAAR